MDRDSDLDSSVTESCVGQEIPESDRAWHIEQHGIDVIPHNERHGHPRQLLWVWTSTTAVYINFIVGGGLVLLGLSVWEAFGAVLIGNLWWTLIGWISVSGPAAGTPSEVITRTMFGIRGNRIFSAGPNVAIGLFYEVTNIAFGTLVVKALFAQAGIELGTASLYVVLAVIAVLCFALPLYGYATIVKLAPWVSAALVIAFIFVGIFVVRAADWGYSPDHVADSSRLPLFLAGCAVVAAGPLSWGTSPDFARYFPATTRKAPVVWWTTFGGFIPTVFLQGIGILAATAMDMNDPEGNIGTIVPGWFTPIFFILVILGQISGNVLTAYSTGLAVQALGVRLSRAKTIVVTGLLATAMAWWCVFAAPHFLDTLYSALAFSGTLLVPLVTIYGVDIVLRRNDYDGMAINDERRGSPFWYTSGYFPAGCIAQTVGTIVGVLCMSNAGVFVGPLAAVFGGADMSIFMGSLVAGALYALLWFKTSPYRDTHLRPGRVQKSFL